MERSTTFTEYMQSFLVEKSIQTVVEIGSDVQLKLALDLSPFTKRYYSVNFPDDHQRMRGWFEMHQSMGAGNIELLSGDGLRLSSLINHADVVIARNLLLDGNNGQETTLMWKYRRGEIECTPELWQQLIQKFDQAEIAGYKEFLKVASPGFVIRFGQPEEDDGFYKKMVDVLKVDPSKITRLQARYDGANDKFGELMIINNH